MIGRTFELVLKQKNLKLPVQFLPHISEPIMKNVIDCKKFNDYLSKIDRAEQGVDVKKIQILNVEMFGSKVGFINMRAITYKDGFAMPSYVFLRGPSVAILLFVNEKVLVVEQFRVPIQETILEAPAGMLDQSGDFVGVAASEIQEETSIKVNQHDLKSLGSYFPSVGGCDEQILMFYCKIQKSEQQIKLIQQKIHGKQGQKQKIKVKLIEGNLSQIILKTKDSKLISLMYAYQKTVQNPSL